MSRSAIFDLDGTLLDSGWVWNKVDMDFLGKRGLLVPDDYLSQIIKMKFDEIAVYTIERFGLDEKPEDIMKEWNDMAIESYKNDVKLKPGAKEFLALLKENNIKMGIATSNYAELYMPCLERHGIADYFHSRTEVSEVARGKGFPDIYLEQAKKMGVSGEECVVFEDIFPALKCSKEAGFYTVGVKEDAWNTDSMNVNKYCDYIIENYYEAVNFFEELFLI